MSLEKQKEKAGATFWLLLGMGVLLFLPFLIYDKGYFIYYGDFNAQQIPFYQLAHDAVRQGNIGWSWLTDLGANFIGSYSFYLLGSPFFWLTLPFPTAWLPYMMAPLLILKIALAGTAAYGYARRFIAPDYAMLVGVLYAFSGFSFYNIFFNHFHEAMIWFPLMLLGMEQYMKDGRRGLFAVAVFISALCNYYFFIGQALFMAIYWLIRVFSGEWEHPVRRFFGLWLEALIGTVCATVILLPSYYAVIQNTRVDSKLVGFKLLIYGTSQRLYDILHSFLFPPEIVARANFFPDANNKWASMSAWLPVFGCTGVIAYFQSRRPKDWLRRLLIALFFCAVIPGFNAAFQLLNTIYYARWFYMMVLFLALATVMCFEQENEPVEWGRAITWTGIFTGFFSLAIGLLPPSWSPDEETGKLKIGLEKYPGWFWLYVGIAAACLLITGLLVNSWRRHPEGFAKRCLAVVVTVSLAFGWCYVTIGKSIANYPDEYVIEKLIRGGNFDLPDEDSFFRTDMNKGMDNQGMYWQMPTIQAFHSIVPGSVMAFYDSIGVDRTVASRPDSEHYALRGLTSVRWLFDYVQPQGDVQLYSKDADEYFSADGETAMPGWKYTGIQDGFAVYENEYFIPMGFTYDYYLTRSRYNELSEDTREKVLLKAIVLEDEDESKTDLPALSTEEMLLTEVAYKDDCLKRKQSAATSFATDKKGFSATISLEEDNMVFFSVPYEEGWTATVNGKPAEVLQVNVGFMAVVCPAGENVEIRFDYETPGLIMGAEISAVALAVLLVYLLIALIHNHRLKKRSAPLPEVSAPAQDTPITPMSEGDFDLYAIYQPEHKDANNGKEEPKHES